MKMTEVKSKRCESWKNNVFFDELTGSKTSIWQSKWTASCVAWLLRLYRVASDGGLCALLIMWDLAPSHAYLISSREGEPSSSVINSSCGREKVCHRLVIRSNSFRERGTTLTSSPISRRDRVAWGIFGVRSTHLLHGALGLEEDPPA